MPATARTIDLADERARIAETLLRSAGRLILGRNESEIVAGVCETLVRTSPHIRLAWTWFGPVNTEVIAPQVCAGPAADYGRTLVIRRNLLTQNGPAFRALDGRAADPFEVSPRSLYGPWRLAAKQHGVRTALALSLPSTSTGQGGIFVLYADRPDYFAQVGVGLFESLAELFGSVLSVASERQALEHAAYHDALTGLLNRHAVQLVERRLMRSTAFAPRSCLLLLDLDHFKQVNDQHGHEAGDRLLRHTARVMRRVLRRRDEALRWGGEEFLIVLPDTGPADALTVADKLRGAVAAADEMAGVTCSIGVAELGVGETLLQAVERADAALYRAKAEGRNRVQVHEA